MCANKRSVRKKEGIVTVHYEQQYDYELTKRQKDKKTKKQKNKKTKKQKNKKTNKTNE